MCACKKDKFKKKKEKSRKKNIYRLDFLFFKSRTSKVLQSLQIITDSAF